MLLSKRLIQTQNSIMTSITMTTYSFLFLILLYQSAETSIEAQEYLAFSESAIPDMLELKINEPHLLSRNRRAAPTDNSTSTPASDITTSEPNATTSSTTDSMVSSGSTTEPVAVDGGVTDDGNSTDIDTSSNFSAPLDTTPSMMTTSTPKPTTPVFNTTTIRDNHLYYISHTYNEPGITSPYLSMFRKKFTGVSPSHEFLKKAYGRVKLFTSSFNFLFYGHSMNHIAITTGGFLYMSNFLHPHLTHSQYIAPLMGQFHTIQNKSDIYHVDDGKSFWVLWKNVYLNGKESVGPFTFYTVIHRNGTIAIAYEKLPILPKDMTGLRKMGLSDAFYQDVMFAFAIRIRRIYRYHVMEINPNVVREGTVVVMDPLLTCHQLATCSDCLSGRSNFTCNWCPAAGRCSSGIDRRRQEWVEKSCHRLTASNIDCNKTAVSTIINPTGKPIPVTSPPSIGKRRDQPPPKGLSGATTAGIIFLVLALVGTVVALTMWCRYAYTHPSSPSGIWLMENRPTVLKQKMTTFFRGGPDPGERYQVSFNAQESVA